MKIINFKSKLPLTSFSPNYNYFIVENNINNDVKIDDILSLMLNREKELTKNKNPKDLTPINRYKIFNVDLLEEEIISTLIINIKKHLDYYLKTVNELLPDNLWMQVWCNILRNNQRIEIHQHEASETSYLSGNLCLTDNNTKTNYINPQTYFKTLEPEYFSENKKGVLTMFPSLLPHYTDKVDNDEIRVTISFDIFIKKDVRKNLWDKQEDELFKNNIFKLKV